MGLFSDLWLPIVLSAVIVFVVSSIIHMALPIHKSDYKRLPGEAKTLEQMRAHGIAPGTYMFPYAGSMREMGSLEMVEKFKQGPVGIVTVRPPGPPGMGANLAMWFLYSLLIGVFAGYVGMLGLSRGADSLAVFRVTGTVAILGYGASYIPDSIWKGQSWRTTMKFVFDGIIYGLLTAWTFTWLWPEA